MVGAFSTKLIGSAAADANLLGPSSERAKGRFRALLPVPLFEMSEEGNGLNQYAPLKHPLRKPSRRLFVQGWLWLLLMALGFQLCFLCCAGCAKGLLRGPLSAMQVRAVVFLEESIWLMSDQDENSLGHVDLAAELREKTIYDHGNEVLRPIGAVALEDSVRTLIPREEWPDQPTGARVRATRNDWEVVGNE